MNLTFTKFYLPEYFNDERIKFTKLKLNYVYENHRLIGQYFCKGKMHWFKNFENETIVKVKRRLFQSTQYLLINKENLQQVGYFEIPNPLSQNMAHISAIGNSNTYLKIYIGKDVYQFRREPPEINYLLSDKKTWGYYAFAFYDSEMNQKILYDFKIVSPLLKKSDWAYHNLDGTIKCSEIDYQLLFAGFFLLEKIFSVNKYFV